MSPVFDPRSAMQALLEGEVRFIVIGGLAGRLHGSNLVTNDLDICYSRAPDNLERLASVLRDLEASLRGAPKDVPFLLDAETLKAGDHFTFDTVFGPLDCLGTPAGVAGYGELERTAVEADLDGTTVKVASIDDLIAMKLAAGRPQDLYQAEVLGALREEIDRLDQY